MTLLRNSIAGIASAVAVGSMVAVPFVPQPARAQQEANDAQDPPDRVGRVALLTGTVSFRTTEDSTWETATLNYPVTSNNAFWTEPASYAEFDLGGEWRLTRTASVYFQGRNILNDPQQWYESPTIEGQAGVLRIMENYGANWVFGVKGSF